jgi:hypothetical protein
VLAPHVASSRFAALDVTTELSIQTCGKNFCRLGSQV